jgi:hypothetical protein
MAEEEMEQPDGVKVESLGSQERHITHWVEVLDRWVMGFDKGMGGQIGGADGLVGKDGSIEDGAGPVSGEAE